MAFTSYLKKWNAPHIHKMEYVHCFITNFLPVLYLVVSEFFLWHLRGWALTPLGRDLTLLPRHSSTLHPHWASVLPALGPSVVPQLMSLCPHEWPPLCVFVCLFVCFECVTLPWNSLCKPGWPPTHRHSPASTSRVLGVKAWATNAYLFLITCLSLGMELRGQLSRVCSPSTVWETRIELRVSGLVASPFTHEALHIQRHTHRYMQIHVQAHTDIHSHTQTHT